MTYYSIYAHSIKNPHIKHLIVRSDGRWRYACMGACAITKSKSTKEHSEVTCKNCKRVI